MHFLSISLSHKSASIDLREKVAMDAAQCTHMLEAFKTRYPKAEALCVSTCNRTELYIARGLHENPNVEEAVELIASANNMPTDAIRQHVDVHEKIEALRHLYRVTAGLESMVIGENQIVSQLKTAYDIATEAGTIGSTFHRIIQHDLSTNKKLRSQTILGDLRLSVSSAAVDFAGHLFSDISERKIMLIGAGEMSELTLKHFSALNPKSIHICNRTLEHAEALADKFDAKLTPWDQMQQQLEEVDILISSTGSRDHLITKKSFKPIVKARRYKPIFMIDIALPRDIDPAVGDLQNVYLYDLDDLQAAMAQKHDQLQEQLADCDAMIAQAIGEAYALVQTGDFNDLIGKLHKQVHTFGSEENSRTLNRLLEADPDRAEKILEEHTHRLINKILHKPMSTLSKQSGTEAALYAAALRRLFDLDHKANHGDDTASLKDIISQPDAMEEQTNEPKD